MRNLYHYTSVNASAERKHIRRIVAMPSAKIVWEIRPSKHRHTFDLISKALPFGRFDWKIGLLDLLLVIIGSNVGVALHRVRLSGH